jgi:hypothetical protein
MRTCGVSFRPLIPLPFHWLFSEAIETKLTLDANPPRFVSPIACRFEATSATRICVASLCLPIPRHFYAIEHNLHKISRQQKRVKEACNQI